MILYFLISAKNEISICNGSPVAETTNLVKNAITKNVNWKVNRLSFNYFFLYYFLIRILFLL